MTLDLVSAFKRAHTALNRSEQLLLSEELSFRIYYWGFMAIHYDNSQHRHSFFEACYVMDGYGSYIEGEHTYELKPGTNFISRPGVWHQIKSNDGMALCYVAFDPEHIACSEFYINCFQLLMQQEKPLFSPNCSQTLGTLWTALVMMFNQPNPFPSLAVQNTVHALMLTYLSEQLAHYVIGDKDPVFDASALLYRQAKMYIDDNLSQSLSLKLVANHLNISSRHLTRVFIQHSHQSIVHYIQEQRVQLAKELLRSSSKEIKHIASICGFDSVHYFTRVFTNKLGVSPAKFRKSLVLQDDS